MAVKKAKNSPGKNLYARLNPGSKKRPQKLLKTPDETTVTKWQERVSAAIFKSSFDSNHVYSYDEIVNGKGSNGQKIQKIIFKEFPEKYMADDSWLINWHKQQETFYKAKVKGPTGSKKISARDYEYFDRDAASGFMDFIEKKIKIFGISKKDTWNPADIWLVQNRKRVRKNIELAIDQSGGNIKYLNDAMKSMLAKRDLVGVSLKKISGKDAKWVVLNLGNVFNFIGKGPPKYECGKVKCNLSITTGKYVTASPITGKKEGTEWKMKLAKLAKKHPGMFKSKENPTGEARAFQSQAMEIMIMENGKNWAKLEIKSTSSSSATGSNLKFEPTGEESKAARWGKADVNEVAKLFKSLGYPAGYTLNDWTRYPRKLSTWLQRKSEWTKYANNIKGWADIDVSNGKQFADNVTSLFQEVDALAKRELKKDFKTLGYSSKVATEELTDIEGEEEIIGGKRYVVMKWDKKYNEAKWTSNRLRFNIVSKLMVVKCASILKDMSTTSYKTKSGQLHTHVNNLEAWLTNLAMMSQKIGKGFGPFGKLY